MKKENKILLFGGIGLAVLTFIGFKVFSKEKKVIPTRPTPTPNRNTNTYTNEEIFVDDSNDYIEINQVMSVETREGTRLRSEPSTSSDILTTYSKGVQLYVIDNIIKDDGLWYRVDDGEFMIGWVRSDVVDNLQTVITY